MDQSISKILRTTNDERHQASSSFQLTRIGDVVLPDHLHSFHCSHIIAKKDVNCKVNVIIENRKMATLARLFWGASPRPRADHDPIPSAVPDDSGENGDDIEEGRAGMIGGGTDDDAGIDVAGVADADDAEVSPDASNSAVPSAEAAAAANSEEVSAEEGDDNNNADTDADEDDDIAPNSERDRLRRYETARHLAELEEERDVRRRRNSTCTLIVVFFLFRLWVQALAESDVGLLLLSLLGTSWTIRWVQTQRETEDEIDRAIHDYIQRADVDENGALSASALARASAIESADLRVMSFQAQLALAILESQRQAMENGGYDGEPQEEDGLDDDARGRWSRYTYHHHEQEDAKTGEGRPRGKKRFGRKSKRGGYGSVPSLDGGYVRDLEAGGPVTPSSSSSSLPRPPPGGIYDLSLDVEKGGDSHDKDALCSICLCEYEENDSLSRVPCGHIYHDDCITAWTEHHVRCPLCNFDLRHDHPSELNSRSTSNIEDSIV